MPLSVSMMEKTIGVFVLSPVGSIDANTVKILEDQVDAILKLSPKVMVLNMEGVNFISSIGVRLVFKAKKAMEAKSGLLSMINLKPQIKKVFDIINAIPDLNIFTSIGELDNYLAEIQKKNTEQ